MIHMIKVDAGDGIIWEDDHFRFGQKLPEILWKKISDGQNWH